MTLYPYETQLVVDGDGEHMILDDGLVGIYGPSDTGLTTLLTLVDPAGVSLPNPLQASPQGFLPAFQATLPQVMWAESADGAHGYLNSFKGVLEAMPPAGGGAGQVLAKNSATDFDMSWATRPEIIVIGPSAAWPTDLPDGTIVVRSEV